MGNLLGSPITTKDTHTGTTLLDSNTTSQSSNIDNNGGGGLEYGISSMQGWRVHMEDAHICQPFLYAEKKLDENSSKLRQQQQNGGENDCESAAIEISLKQENSTRSGDGLTDDITQVPSKPPINNSNNNKNYYTQIALPNHSLFAVFDGHGGSFAAEYAARNLLRVLSRQSKFVLYAERWRDREDYLAGVLDSLSGNGGVGGSGEVVNDAKLEEDGGNDGGNDGTNDDVDKQRLQELKQRGRESDESVKKIKERVRRHLGTTTVSASTDDSDVDSTNNDTTTKATTSSKQQTKKEGWWKSPATPTTPQRTTTTSHHNDTTTNTPSSNTVNLPTTPQNNTNALQIATAAYDHNLMTLLESSLRDAFCDLDREIYEEVVVSVNGGMRVRDGDDFGDRNSLYGVGYAGSGVGHLPKSGDGSGEDSTALSSTLAASTSTAATDTPQQQQQQPPPPPTPTDDEDSGTTASIVLLTPRWIVCANAGDSRAVYSRSNHRVVALSYDHKPDDEEEERRITDAGGYVSAGRVEGDLAVSRGLGDFRFKEEAAVLSGAQGENRDGRGSSSSAAAKNNGSSMLKPGDQKVSPVPDIIVQNRDRAEDEFIIIACDGIWDVQTNQECVKMVADMFSEGEDDLGLICEEVLDLCLIKGSKDNMTAAVIKFPRQVVGKGGGVMARRERRGAVDDGEKDEHTTTAATADDVLKTR
mmetsp:Transcript_9133/g.15529  ORF Transcript_9133/g.15529 Transcript_9133/m.15529 type:complete len:700 (+) Transcript_9133:114-2213(+)